MELAEVPLSIIAFIHDQEEDEMFVCVSSYQDFRQTCTSSPQRKLQKESLSLYWLLKLTAKDIMYQNRGQLGFLHFFFWHWNTCMNVFGRQSNYVTSCHIMGLGCLIMEVINISFLHQKQRTDLIFYSLTF